MLRVVFYRERHGSIDIETYGIADLLEGDRQLVFDGLDGEIEDLGYLAVFEAVFLDEFKDDLAFWRELIDRSFDKSEHVGGDQQLFGIEVNAGKLCVEFFEGVGGSPFLMVEVIECGIANGNVEIYSEVVDLFEITPLFPNANKDIGYDLFGGFSRFDHRFCKEE